MQKPTDEALFDHSIEIDEEEDFEDDERDNEINICCICLLPLTKESLPVTLSCKHIGHYNCFMGIRNHLCPLCRAPIPKELSKKAEIEADLAELTEDTKWLYKAKSKDAWWYFESGIAKQLEEGYQIYKNDRNKKTVDIIIRGYEYTVDFSTMKQSSSIGNSRDIKRLKKNDSRIDILGVGGMTIKENNKD